jgi:transcription elongation factor Elf1
MPTTCPNCGSSDIYVQEYRDRFEAGFYVYCRMCGYSTTVHLEIKDALSEWDSKKKEIKDVD